MSRTRNAQKKYEGRMRKLKAKEKEVLKEEERREEEEKRYWSIGAKDDTKEKEREIKRQERIARNATRKKIYDEEHGN